MSQTAEQLSSQTRSTEQPLRFVTAASLFDGHDAAINIMRRLIQGEGCEVVHLGHNRSVRDIVDAAIQEDADGIAVSSYQGGHNEFFRYMVEMLAERGASHIRVFGGGGGTITPEEIRALHEAGVERIYHPDDGMQMGLKEMIEDLVDRTRRARATRTVADSGLPAADKTSEYGDIAQALSAIENGSLSEHEVARLQKDTVSDARVPVVGLTGTGGAGKSSVTEGALVTANQITALAVVQNLDRIYVDVNQSSEALLALKKGLTNPEENSRVRLFVGKDGIPYDFYGKLLFSDVTVDQSTGMVQLRVLFPNPDNDLLPGLFVRARVEQSRREKAIVVPQQSVVRNADGSVSVWVVDKENIVKNRNITVLQALKDQWVVSSGLAPGDRVVVAGLQKISNQAKVTTVEFNVLANS